MKKLLSWLLSAAVVLTSFAGINVFAQSGGASAEQQIKAAAESYVAENKNNVTADGLLAAVKEIDSTVTLDTANDFYIKHALPGVKDKMKDNSENTYPLNIEGSDGAVAAVFVKDGVRYPFATAFAHEVETIEIGEVAVVGTSEGFTYEENKTLTESGVSYTYEKVVTSYTGTADKIVIPADFKGTFVGSIYDSSNPIRYSSVKVLIINNTEPLYKSGFEGWSSLKAVQFADTTAETAWYPYSNPNYGDGGRVFCHCHELKYVKLPSVMKGPWSGGQVFPQYMFCQCWKLENINLPTIDSKYSGTLPWRMFDGTAVKEFNLPQNYSYASNNRVFNNSDSSSLKYGTQRVIKYTDNMSELRAVTLATAKANEILGTATDKTEALSAIKAAVSGAHNAAAIAEKIQISLDGNNDFYTGYVLGMTVGSDVFKVENGTAKALESLDIGVNLTPGFNPAVSSYTATVVNEVTDIAVSYTAVEGATVGAITGNTDLTVGENVISIPVTTGDNNTVNYTITVTRAGTLPTAIKAAADGYVDANKNNVTAEGLLAAVKEIDSTVTLDTANDFYIKHAVPGVKDKMANASENTYPLNIEGSDGAVAAVFEYNGAHYGYTRAFAHEVETIEIGEVAVVGTSAGFTYDESGNVTAYSGTADKMVIPENYKGTINELSDLSTVQGIEVVVINNTATTALANEAFMNWDGLIAVQIANQTTKSFFSQWNDDNGTNARIFANCDNLKYVKLPDKAVYAGWNVLYLPYGCFENSPKLENVNMPSVNNTVNHPVGWHTFYGTSLREIVLPQYATVSDVNKAFDNPKYSEGTRNIHLNTDSMTLMRAAALAAASVNELSGTLNDAKIKATALGAIKGTGDSSAFVASLNWISATAFNSSDYADSAKAYISDGNVEIPISYNKNKALKSLTADYALTPAFDPAVTEYTVSVPAFVTEVNVNATAVDGAKVGEITGTTITGDTSVITVNVTNTDGKNVTYTINVQKKTALPDNVYAVADAYIKEKKNEADAAGLLAAVQTVWANAVLKVENFYIKHAVNGVTDNDTVSGYPLSIEGSNGAVTALIENDGATYSFSTSFDFTTEMLNIKSYAIVGSDDFAEYFTYDESGNVTALNKPVEKLIFPAGYNGTMTALSGESLINADRVKVVIYNNGVTFLRRAFNGWNGLVAVQLGDKSDNMSLGYVGSNNDRHDHMFSGCANLKYFKFPEKICNTGYWNAMFPNSFLENCPKLETVIMPTVATSGQYTTYGYHSFYGTAIREAIYPSYGSSVSDNDELFGGTKVTAGTRNIHYPSDAMTLLRATALAAANISSADGRTADSIIATAKQAICGSTDAEQFANALDYRWTETDDSAFCKNGRLFVSDGENDVYINAVISKGLSKIEVGGSKELINFKADISSYTVALPYTVLDVDVTATAVDGAEVQSVELSKNGNTVTVEVKNIDGDTANYTLNITRYGSVDATVIANIRKALLMLRESTPIDMNRDGAFDIIDLIRAKKQTVASDEVYTGNIMLAAANTNGFTADDMTETFAYVDKNGNITDTMFDGVTFVVSPEWLYDYSTTTTTRRNTTKREWSNFVYNNILLDNLNMNAIEKSVGEIKYALDKPNYKAAVYMPLFVTNAGFNGWGNLNGKALDFSSDADRIAALKWLVDESISAFNAMGYENISLVGFYYCDEAMRDGDINIMPTLTEYVRTKNLTTIWAPYSDANGSKPNDQYKWKDYGFDAATYQINYFPGRSDLPAAREESYIKYISDNSKADGASIEMELCGRTKENISGLKKYFEGGIDYGFMNNDLLTWWIWNDGYTIKYLAESEDEYIRSAYDEMYKFIKKELTKAEINNTTGE